MGVYIDIFTRPMICHLCLNTLGKVALGHVWWCSQCNLWKMDRMSRWRLDCCKHSSLWKHCTAASRISTSRCCQKHMLFSPAVLLGNMWVQHQHGVVAFPWLSVPCIRNTKPETNYGTTLGSQRWGLWLGLLLFPSQSHLAWAHALRVSSSTCKNNLHWW